MKKLDLGDLTVRSIDDDDHRELGSRTDGLMVAKDATCMLPELSDRGSTVDKDDFLKTHEGIGPQRIGAISLDVIGGTAGSDGMYDGASDPGTDGMVPLHVPNGHLEEIRIKHLGIVAGHMNAGPMRADMLADRREARGLQISPCPDPKRDRRM